MSILDAILSLEDHHCRFPIGEGEDFHFCGMKRTQGLPYCEPHAVKCFTRDIDPVQEVDAPARELEAVE